MVTPNGPPPPPPLAIDAGHAVTADVVGHDPGKRATATRIQHASGGERDRAAVVERPPVAQPVVDIVGGHEEEIAGLPALDIDDANVLAGLDTPRSTGARCNDVIDVHGWH